MAISQQESREQSAVVSWFKRQYPLLKECILSIPNGAHLAGKSPEQRTRKMAKMKREGLKPGASDLFIAVPVHGKSGLWLEMKAKGITYCKVTQEQRDHIEMMKSVGYCAEWAAGFEQAVEIIKKYMDGRL